MEVFFNRRLKKKNDIWNLEFSDSTKEEFDCEPICNKRYLKSKIKSYGDETTDFRDEEIH